MIFYMLIGKRKRLFWAGTSQEDHQNGWEIWEQVQAIHRGLA